MDGLLLRLFDFEARLPGFLRPPFRGGVFLLGLGLGLLGKLFFAAILILLVLTAGPWEGLRLFVGILGVAMVAGVGGGIVAGLLESLGRLGRGGEWCRWVLAIFAFLLTCSLLAPGIPFALPDPAFYWVAGIIAAVGATGLVWTDDRGPHRLPPHQFRLVRSLSALKQAPKRYRAAAEDRMEGYERRRRQLLIEAAKSPRAGEDLDRLRRVVRTDLSDVAARLRRFYRLTGGDAAEMEETEAWLARLEAKAGWRETLPLP